MWGRGDSGNKSESETRLQECRKHRQAAYTVGAGAPVCALRASPAPTAGSREGPGSAFSHSGGVDLGAGQGSPVLAQLRASSMLKARAVLKIIPRLRRRAQGSAASSAASDGSYLPRPSPLSLLPSFRFAEKAWPPSRSQSQPDS